MSRSELTAYQKRAQKAQAKHYKQWGNKRWTGPGRYGELKWARAYRDEKSGKSRCESCARSSFIVTINEQRIKTKLRSVKVNYGRIVSRKQRNELLSFFGDKINPGFIRGRKSWTGAKKGRKNKQPSFWSKVSFRIGRCLYCKKLTFSHSKTGPTSFHQRPCWWKWIQTAEGREYNRARIRGEKPTLPSIGAGNWATEESLKMYLHWTELHYFRHK
jgi:hypothetical protein